MNYYELLEVSPKASAAVIRAAYKSLMQRYHPDRNPGDPAVARMAALIVQAFEVLSDETKRSAYDRELQASAGQARASHADAGRPRAGNPPYWLLAAPGVILAGWLASSFLGEIEAPATAGKRAAVAAGTGALEIRKLIMNLEVKLPAPGAESRSLAIPSIGVRVGTRDPENAMRHLRNTAGLIGERLRQGLGAASVDKLMEPDGERYLSAMILGIVCEMDATPETCAAGPFAPGWSERYGPVEVLLPQSYSVN